MDYGGPYVSILYEEDAEEWGTYMTSCFSHILKALAQHDWNVYLQLLDDIELPLTSARIGKFQRSRLQVIILSPKFLKYVAKHPNVVLGQLFDPSRVICLLCGVTTEDVTATHRASLASYDSWRKMLVVDNDTDFGKRLFNLTEELIKDESQYQLFSESSAFKLNPCKVREGFAKVTIELVEPIPDVNSVSCHLETENSEAICLNVKQYNPYTLKICIPDRFFGISQVVGIHLKHDGESLGQRPLKCESKMAELDQLLNSVLDPLSFMCQTLGLPSCRTDREGLDRYLVERFQKHSVINGLHVFDVGDGNGARRKSEDELPTLLHWSAKYGLQELCSVLLDCPKAAEACNIKNRNGLTAADIAEANNFSCLATMLENYMRLSETAEMYICMKNMTETMHTADYENFGAKLLYTCDTMASNVDHVTITNAGGVIASDAEKSSVIQRNNSENKSNESKDSIEHLTHAEIDACLRNKQMYSKCQQELIQLLEDFKNDKYTLSEVELLCQSLQLSHRSRSFNEKQTQLKLLRQHYEQAQKNRQQDEKKLNTFERLQTFFKKSTKRETQISSPIIRVTTSYVKPHVDADSAVGSPSNTSPKTSTSSMPFVRTKSRPSSSWSSGSRSSSVSDRSSTMSGVSSQGSVSDGASALCDIGEEFSDDKPTKQSNNLGPNQSGKINFPFIAQNMQYLQTNEFSEKIAAIKLRSLSASNHNHTPPHPGISLSKSAPDERRMQKPLPLPRPLNTMNVRSPFLNPTMPDYCIDDDVYCPLEPAPLPPSSNGGKSLQNCQLKDHYYVSMEGSKSSPALLHTLNGSSSLADITMEPEYCNLPAPVKITTGEYLEMRSNKPSVSLRARDDRLLYENVIPYDNNYSEERFDSVPNVPPPAIPIEIGSNGTMQRGPPVPPRNPPSK